MNTPGCLIDSTFWMFWPVPLNYRVVNWLSFAY
jgi:hypothetical protein